MRHSEGGTRLQEPLPLEPVKELRVGYGTAVCSDRVLERLRLVAVFSVLEQPAVLREGQNDRFGPSTAIDEESASSGARCHWLHLRGYSTLHLPLQKERYTDHRSHVNSNDGAAVSKKRNS